MGFALALPLVSHDLCMPICLSDGGLLKILVQTESRGCVMLFRSVVKLVEVPVSLARYWKGLEWPIA